ncbi:MAG TPA: polysaccharide deacetylase family protein [Polyangiaceae bacterium]|nr:polysaccharide deacetylase family protein [Polyangiaceae bacterium]
MRRRQVTNLALLSVLACSGPELTPEIDPSQPTGPEIIEPHPPLGGVCAPAQGPNSPLVSQVAEAEAAGDCPNPPAPDLNIPIDSFNPVRPMGVGYPGAINALPPHVAYLTFDDGPSEWTHTFLDILRDKGVKATFFVTAKQLKGEQGLDATYRDPSGNTIVFRDVLKRELDEGHQLANHTVNHIDLAHVTSAQITSEIDENEFLVNRALVRAGSKPELLTLFRPPYGSPWFTGIAGPSQPQASARVSSHALNIMWTVTSGDATDWAIGESYSNTATPTLGDNPPTFEAKKQRVLHDVVESAPTLNGDGLVVLMHDTHSATRDVLPQIIDGLAAKGYSFETIEHYVQWRWGRPSSDLTPGPGLYQSCVPDRDWGCEALGSAPLGGDRASEVCGRMWVAYHAFGGRETLGAPLGAPERSEESGIVSQAFEAATLELHPENPPPCNMIAFPR